MLILALLWTTGGSVGKESTFNVGDLSWDLQCLVNSWKMASIMRKWYAKYLGGFASFNSRRHNWVLKKKINGGITNKQNLSLSKPQMHRHIYFSMSTNIYENCPSSIIYLSLIYLWHKPKMVKSDWNWQTLKWKIGWVVIVPLCLSSFVLFFYFKHK